MTGPTPTATATATPTPTGTSGDGGTSRAGVAVVGGGVVGAAVLHALAHHGVDAVLLEADAALGYGASGTNSGILHTGFDSTPGSLETTLIRRSAALRDRVLDGLDVPVLRCGAVLRPRDDDERATTAALVRGAQRNGVPVHLDGDGALHVPGESVTDPVALVLALAGSAVGAGARVRTGARVVGIDDAAGPLRVHLADGGAVAADRVVNCAGLHADEVARLVGDDSFEVYPRKGEFLVFELPGGQRLEQVLLPVPTARTKGVLVFPTLDGRVVAGPTAVDGTDKRDWTVRPEAAREVLDRAVVALPALEGLAPVASYAGLRPAGRGSNYVIGPSRTCPRLVNVAAVRSTGLSASLGIAAHVLELLAAGGLAVGPERPLTAPAPVPGPRDALPWWARTARRHGLATA